MVLTSLLNQQWMKISNQPKPIRNGSTGFVLLPCSLAQLLQLLAQTTQLMALADVRSNITIMIS